MKLNKKIEGFTLSEMLVVIILTAIVVGLAFSVLSLVQRHLYSIQNNYNNTTELNKLETALWIDFNRYSTITYDAYEKELKFVSEIDSVKYQFSQDNLIKGRDTFPVPIAIKTLYFDAKTVEKGTVDAIKLECSKAFQKQTLFIYKKNAASAYMN